MDPEQAYRRYFPLVVQHARRMLGDGGAAEDVAQEAFLRFLAVRVDGGDPGVVAWLYRTSANLAIDVVRRRSSWATAGWRPPAEASASTEAALALRSTLAQLSRDMPTDVLRAGLLSRADGLTQPELATLLEVSERTVRRWLTTFDEAARRLAAETLS